MDLPVLSTPSPPNTKPTHGLIFQSLKQSRNKWLTTFPKFAHTSNKSANTSNSPPVQQIHLKGRCDIVIGPHTFPNTSFYQVTYAMTKEEKAVVDIVHVAAANNPTLAQLVALASLGLATETQWTTLAILIQSLPGVAASHAAGLFKAKPYDLLLEFAELPNERFLFPKSGPIVVEKDDEDIKLRTRIPFPDALPYNGIIVVQPQVATFVLRRPPDVIKEVLTGWIDSSTREQAQAELKAIPEPKRVYLQYDLEATREGGDKDGSVKALLESLVHASQHPSAALLRPIQPSAGAVTIPARKRKPVGEPSAKRARTHTAASATPATATPAISGASSSTIAIVPSGSKPRVAKTPTPKAKANTSTASAKKLPAANQQPLRVLECLTCHAKDVPLILGGRYCRACVDKGRNELALPPSAFNAPYGSYGANFSPAPITATHSRPFSTPAAAGMGSSAAGAGVEEEEEEEEETALPVNPIQIEPTSP